jgi:hypothetical protein
VARDTHTPEREREREEGTAVEGGTEERLNVVGALHEFLENELRLGVVPRARDQLNEIK